MRRRTSPAHSSDSPASGAVLPPGMQTLSATFTPTDAIDYAVCDDDSYFDSVDGSEFGDHRDYRGRRRLGFQRATAARRISRKLSNPVGVAIDYIRKWSIFA